MPYENLTTSKAEEENTEEISVLDFLYHDSRRIGSFLSQFEGDGFLQQLTRNKSGTRGSKNNSKKQGGINIGFGSGKIDADKEASLSIAEGYTRVFDPYWANAREFLNFVIEKNILKNDISLSSIGQFVKVNGYLSVSDLGMIKNAWKVNSIQKKIMGGAAPEKSAAHMTAAEKAAFKREEKESQENSELLLDMLQMLPHSINASLITDEEDLPSLVWGALREEYLTMPASEIVLAHGSRLPGIWSIVGILTALPEWVVPDLNKTLNGEIGVLNSMVGQVSEQLAPIVRFALGRPVGAFAITPLLIFREVA
ncbi:DUF6414 family protein [Sphingomonas sp. Leaf22]|uniref:DUF6414 family protein n=1 Tax=Sphingomonas sp. Leaf22 TaxID=1735687 RepID=UPI000A931D2F